MATHKIKLNISETIGPFDISYRVASSLTFVTLFSDITDVDFSAGLCVTLPTNAVEMKVVNKHLNSNVTIYKQIPQS